jgi:hypothetical protein
MQAIKSNCFCSIEYFGSGEPSKEGEFRPLRPLKNTEWGEGMSKFSNNNKLE